MALLPFMDDYGNLVFPYTMQTDTFRCRSFFFRSNGDEICMATSYMLEFG